MPRNFVVVFVLASLSACGRGGSSTSPPPPPPPSTITSVSIDTSATSLRAGQSFRFTPVVQGTGNFSTKLTWSVNGINGGDSVNGTVTDSGTYTAPVTLPPTNPVTIKATSVQDLTKSDSVDFSIFTLAISPASVTVFYNHTQPFTATVTGITNPTLVWSADHGIVDGNGLYTPPGIMAQNASDAVHVNVQNAGGSSVNAAITLQIPPPVLTSITPNGASAHEPVTINGQDLLGVEKVFFPGPFGTTFSADFQAVSDSQISATVPLGTVDGPVYITEEPIQGVTLTSNSISLTRLPNVRIRASKKDLSSSETVQFTRVLLGANGSTGMTWTADLGSVNASGLYQAPVVTEESFATVKGCLKNTRACDSTMLRIVPLRISPATPVVSLGQNLQLTVLEGSPVSANWSVLAGGGSVTANGLFTAPTNPVQAGPVPVSATAGGVSEITSVGVTGAFPGLISRTYDYMDFGYDPNTGQYAQQLEGTFARTLVVNGNRAYVLGLGTRRNVANRATPEFSAIEVYDISDPLNPVWLTAAETVSDRPFLFATYSHYLFEVDTGTIAGSRFNPPSRVVLYDVQTNPPSLVSYVDAPDLAAALSNGGIIYATPLDFNPGSTAPVHVYDIRNGIIQTSQLELTLPVDALPGVPAIQALGNGNLLYASFATQSSGLELATYDLSVSPPNLLSSVPVTGQFLNGFRMLIRGNLLFLSNAILDISNPVPVQLGTVPVQYVEDVQGTKLLGRGNVPIYVANDNYLVVDIADPSNPVTTANVYDLPDGTFFPDVGVLTANGRYVIAADGQGGFSTIDVSAAGGTRDKARIEGFPTGVIYDHTISGNTMYVSGFSGLVDAGGLVTYDLSTGTPLFSGMVLYGLQPGFAVRVKGNTAFLGLQGSLRIVDVTNPASPVDAGSLGLPTNALALSGNILFDGTLDSRLVSVDVTNPNAPAILGSAPLRAPAITMRLAGSRLFIADGSAGLLIFDVSNPALPVQLSQLSLATPVWDVAASGTLAFLAADWSGLVIVDVTNPLQPKQVSQTILESYNPFPFIFDEGPRSIALAIAVQNGLVYVGTANSLSLVFGYDYSQPAYPRLVSMNAYGEFIDTLISGFDFAGNDLYVFGGLGARTGIVQADNSHPRNTINLYYPPLTLRSVDFGPDRLSPDRSEVFTHPKFDGNLFKRKHRYLRQERVQQPSVAN